MNKQTIELNKWYYHPYEYGHVEHFALFTNINYKSDGPGIASLFINYETHWHYCVDSRRFYFNNYTIPNKEQSVLLKSLKAKFL